MPPRKKCGRRLGPLGKSQRKVTVREVEKEHIEHIEVEQVEVEQVEVEQVEVEKVEVEQVEVEQVEVEKVEVEQVEVEQVEVEKVEVEKVGVEKVGVEVMERDVESEVGKQQMEVHEQDDGEPSIVTPPPRILHARAKDVAGTPRETPKNTPKKRKKNAMPFPFTPDHEKDLAEWYRDNQRFYNKRCRDYRMMQVKQRMMEDKVKEIKDTEGEECTVAQLSMWWNSMRTYYGKLSKEAKSGSGASTGPKPTDRELWIKQSFNFLSDHIIRIKGREGYKLGSYMPDGPGPVDEEDDGLEISSQGSEDTAALQDVDMESAFESVPTSRDGMGRGKSGSTKVKKTSEESDIETIEKICSKLLKTAAPTPGPTSPASAELDNFARDIVSSMRRVPEERWNDVKIEMMMVIRNYSGAAPSVSTDFGAGYRTPALAPSFNPYNYNHNVNAPPRLNRSSHGHGHTFNRPPASTITSPSQYVHQLQPPNMQTQRPGGQYMHLMTTSDSPSITDTNITAASSTDATGVDEYFNFDD